MCENICIYCLKDSSSARDKEHVIPEALGCKEELPKGYVCDSCNNYFSMMDKTILHNRYIALRVGTEGIPSKKGKPRSQIGQNLYFDVKKRGTFTVKLGPVTITPETRQAVFRLEQDKEFDELLFARGIHKITFNCYAREFGRKEALHPRFNNLRNYIRKADKGELWPYSVREAQSNKNQFISIFYGDYGEIAGLHILSLDFVVSFTRQIIDIQSALKRWGFFLIHSKGQWKASSFLGLQE